MAISKDAEKLKILKTRFAFGEFKDEELFNELKHETECRIIKNQKEIENYSKKISNLEFFLNNLTTILQNISKYWMFGNECMKENILKLLFFDGLILNATKRKYLTSNVNILFDISRTISRKWRVLKNKDSSDFTELSSQVSLAGR